MKNKPFKLVILTLGILLTGMFVINNIKTRIMVSNRTSVISIVNSYANDAKTGGHSIWDLNYVLQSELPIGTDTNTSIERVEDNTGKYVKVNIKVNKKSIVPLFNYNYEVTQRLPIDKRYIVNLDGMSNIELNEAVKNGTLIVDGSSTIQNAQLNYIMPAEAGGGGAGGSYTQTGTGSVYAQTGAGSIGGGGGTSGQIQPMTKAEYERALRNPQGGDTRYINP